MQFSVIIVTKGRPVPLRAALQSAADALTSGGELIVVDGDPARSGESVVRELRAVAPDVEMRYITSPAHISLQRNIGIDAAVGEVMVMVDDDCVVERGLFAALALVYADPSVVGATGRVRQPSRALLGNSRRLRWLALGGGRPGSMSSFGSRRPIVDVQRPCDTEFMYGPLMSARREIAAEVRFDERLGAYSLGEDDDFSYRLSRHGRIRYEPSAVVEHGEIGRRAMDQRWIDRQRVVNRSYLFHKNFPRTPRARVGFASHVAVLCAHRLINREWSGLLGLLEGVRRLSRSGPPDTHPPTASRLEPEREPETV
jgi:GT2 family glycosyltransferase